MDRSLDPAAWENFSHKPDLIHLSCWQPEAHQASSWLFASSKRLTPRRTSLTSFALAEASVLLKTAQWARQTWRPDRHEQSPPRQVHGEIQTPSSESKTGGPGCASPHCFQNNILLETINKAATFICWVLLESWPVVVQSRWLDGMLDPSSAQRPGPIRAFPRKQLSVLATLR
ncbi:hypothetical protein MDA_GLEAN10024817 [Myotis davidii]|uniref:Uncharacterized protein n=1 Tax=Myotis davidii TaxID=225400 RepID=L5LXQ2_MYODS|nr:hypothetical protein MDA_GLEAN10024817 [Myotis davidii]